MAIAGSIDSSFDYGTGFNGKVLTTAIDSNDKIYVGGEFTTYQGVAANRIIRLNPDGTIDTAFNYGTGFNGNVLKIKIDNNGKILVGGRFGTYKDVIPEYNIIRLNPDGSKDTNFVTGLGITPFSSSWIEAIDVDSNNDVYLGGSNFSYYNGNPTGRIVKVNNNGGFINTISNYNGLVYSIHVQSDNKVIIGGLGGTYGANTVNGFFRLNSDGTLDNSFPYAQIPSGSIFSIEEDNNGKIYVGGSFTSYSGQTANYIVKLNSDGTIDNSFNSGTGFAYWVRSIKVDENNKIYVGGEFLSYNGSTAYKFLRLNSDGTIDTSYPYGTIINSDVYSLSLYGSNDDVFVGGNFTTYSGQTANRIVKLFSGNNPILNPFIFKVNTNATTANSSANNQYSLPLVSDGTYNFTVYWGDGNSDVITSWNQAEKLHTYSSGGTYTITIVGLIKGWNTKWEISNTVQTIRDNQKLIEIMQFGSLELVDNVNGAYFSECSNFLGITATDVPVTSGITSFRRTFLNNYYASYNDSISNWDVSNATNFSEMFYNNANSLYSLDVSNWNVINATNFNQMFTECVVLTGITGIGNWNVGSVINFDAMFTNCRDLTTLDLSNWNVSSVTNFTSMFFFCESLTSIGDVSNWSFNTLNIFNFAYTFYNCTSLTTITGIGDWDVSNCTSFNLMFTNTPLDVATYDSILDINTGWVSRGVNSNEPFDANLAKYCSIEAQAGREELINTYGWTITDAGLDAGCSSITCDDLVKVTGLTVNDDYYDNQQFVIVWSDDNTQEDFFRVQRSTNGGATWTTIANMPTNIYFHYDTDIELGIEYCYRVAAGKFLTEVEGEPTCLGEWSDVECLEIPIPKPFCSLDNPYTVSGTTSCANDGKIIINNYEVYKNFYTFSLFNIDGNQLLNNIYLNESTGTYESLPAQWYRLVATPTTNYLRDTCEFKWIEVSQDGLIGESGRTITNAICGSFNVQYGRVIIEISGNTNTWWGFIWNEFGESVAFSTNTTPAYLIGENLNAGNYYGYVQDTSGGSCRYTFSFSIKEEQIYSVPNIKEIYVWGYDDKTNPIFWSTENDPDYYGGLDTLKFQSTKIKEFDFYSESPVIFYIPVDEANVSFTQTMEKTRQGLTFANVLTIAYSTYNVNHWNVINTLRGSKWTILFLDANDNYWTFGYEQGAEANGFIFSTEDGGLRLNFTENSKNKIITAVDENYVKNTLLI